MLGCVRSLRVVIRPREGDERVERHKRSTELRAAAGKTQGDDLGTHCILLTLSVCECLSRTSTEFSSCNKALSTFELNPAFDSIGMPICWAPAVCLRGRRPTHLRVQPTMNLAWHFAFFLLFDACLLNVCPTLSWVVRCCLTLPCLSSSAYYVHPAEPCTPPLTPTYRTTTITDRPGVQGSEEGWLR